MTGREDEEQRIRRVEGSEVNEMNVVGLHVPGWYVSKWLSRKYTWIMDQGNDLVGWC